MCAEARRRLSVVEASQMLLWNGGRGTTVQDTHIQGDAAHRACPYQKGKKVDESSAQRHTGTGR